MRDDSWNSIHKYTHTHGGYKQQKKHFKPKKKNRVNIYEFHASVGMVENIKPNTFI